jgi:hypothetical protein
MITLHCFTAQCMANELQAVAMGLPNVDVESLNHLELSKLIEDHEQVKVSSDGSKHTTKQVPIGLLVTSFEDPQNDLIIRYLNMEHTEDLATSLLSGWLKGNSLLARERQVECDEEKYNAIGSMYGKNFTNTKEGTLGAPIYNYLVYDVFDGSHRKTAISLNVTRKLGDWTNQSEVPVTVHNPTLPSAAAVRYAGLVNELQAVAKSGGYSDQLIFLYKNLLRAITKVAPAVPVPQTDPTASTTQTKKKALVAAAKAFKKKQRGQVENYVLDYFRAGVSQSRNILSFTEQKEFNAMFDSSFVRAKLAISEFLRVPGLNTISALERLSLRKASASWDELVPSSHFSFTEMSFGERESLFPTAAHAVKRLHARVTSLITLASHMFGLPDPEVPPVEVGDVPPEARLAIGKRLLCWHAAFYAKRIWRSRVPTGPIPSFNQYDSAKHLSTMYLEDDNKVEVKDAVTKSMQCFWNDIALLSKLQEQYKATQATAAVAQANVLQANVLLNELDDIEECPENMLKRLFLVILLCCFELSYELVYLQTSR